MESCFGVCIWAPCQDMCFKSTENYAGKTIIFWSHAKCRKPKQDTAKINYSVVSVTKELIYLAEGEGWL